MLLAVEHVGCHAVAWGGHQAGVPEDFAVGRVEGYYVGAVAGEEEVAGGGQHVAGSAAAGPVVAPFDLAGLVVDGYQLAAFAAGSAVDAAVTFRMVVGVGLVELGP